MGKIGSADFPFFCIFVRKMVSVMTSVAIIIVKFDVITGFSKPETPDLISMYQHPNLIEAIFSKAALCI